MRFRTIAIVSFLFTATAFAQGDKRSIQGTVSDSVGAALANAPVQAKNADTGAVYKATSTSKGTYSLADPPAGKYEVTVAIPGLKNFSKKAVAVFAAKTEPLDIRLEETTQLSTLGEDTLAIQADAKKPAQPSGPTPRAADGKPDHYGTWWSPRTIDPGKPEWLPFAETTAKQRAKPAYDGRDFRRQPRLSPDLFYLDGRAHPKDPMPAWHGHNAGHWEGDTLVVGRIRFNEQSWLHVVERYTRPDLGHLETEITVEDPAILAKPYTIKRVSDLAPTEDIYGVHLPGEQPGRLTSGRQVISSASDPRAFAHPGGHAATSRVLPTPRSAPNRRMSRQRANPGLR